MHVLHERPLLCSLLCSPNVPYSAPEMKEKYENKIAEMLTGEEHVWLKGLEPEEAEALRKMYQERYHQ